MFGFGKKPVITLRISAAAYDEIAGMLAVIGEDGVIDMSGIGLVRGPEPVQQPKHRPISNNRAPGAI